MAMMPHPDKILAKYLGHYAEPEARISAQIPGMFDVALVIPAYDEGDDLFATLRSIPSGLRTLAVVVLNATSEAPPTAHATNAATRQRLIDGFRIAPLTDRSYLGNARWGALLLIDRARQDSLLPPHQGVGLARKIGADVVLALWAAGRLHRPWIHTTDADVALPTDYFERLAGSFSRAAAAALYPFCHVEAEGAPTAAAATYECWLRYYVLGLGFAGSPYAFHTIGSTLAVHAWAYAATRGFPARQAGEDFYMLNKLAKVGAVLRLRGQPLRLSCRLSTRVPFGTGQALRRIEGAQMAQPRFYHPQTFVALRAWLQTVQRLAHDPTLHIPIALAHGKAQQLAHRVLSVLGAPAALEKARRQSRTAEGCARRLHIWFDARKTLRFMHVARDLGTLGCDLWGALDAAPFVPSHAIRRHRSGTVADFGAVLCTLKQVELATGPTETGLGVCF